MKIRKPLGIIMAAVMMGMLAGCGPAGSTDPGIPPEQTAASEAGDASSAAAETGQSEIPEYVFLFIGDGMSYPQIESTDCYLYALEKGSSMGNRDEGRLLSKEDGALNFMDFSAAGSAQTYSSISFCPDSASAGTAISTGHKTGSGILNMDETCTVRYETISEKLKERLGYKIGIVSSVNLNHATPAAFYCHQESRLNYYEIGLELIGSGFDYFAGGELIEAAGAEGKQTDLYELAEKDGYTVIRTQDEAEKADAGTGKMILIDEHPADSGTMDYEIDREEDQWALADYVSKGIECLREDNEKGFFMMVEGGKIDWACHANDAASVMADTKALSDAVDEAIDFYNEHPDETLIIVTGDHETGGLSIGSAGTYYDTFLQNLEKQKISFQAYNDEYVSEYKKNDTGFDDVMKDVAELFGLIPESAGEQSAENGVLEDRADSHPSGAAPGDLVLTDYELSRLEEAYQKTMSGDTELSQEEYELYGNCEPLTVTITHILNHKSGISFTSYSHTGLPAAVFAQGAGADLFDGFYDNTEIYEKMAAILQLE